MSQYEDIPLVSTVTQQQVMDNYYQVKMEVKRLIRGIGRAIEGRKDRKLEWLNIYISTNSIATLAALRCCDC